MGGTCLATNYSNQGLSATLNPGNFSVTGETVTLKLGIYHFQNGTVGVASSASLVGSGVTLFLDADSTLAHSGREPSPPAYPIVSG